MGFPDGSVGKESACDAKDLGSIPGSGNGRKSLEKEMANHSSMHAWEILWTPDHGVARVRHDLVTKPTNQHKRNFMTNKAY